MPIIELLEAIFPSDDTTPTCAIYDRSCFVHKFLSRKLEAEDQLCERERRLVRRWFYRMKWLVDRFHFAGHSVTDNVCRSVL